MASPVLYSPAVETLADNEAETISGIIDAMQTITATTFRDEGRAVRAVHAKAHGLLTGEFTIVPDLPPELAQGLFAQPETFRATLRLSTSPGDIVDDAISTPRGLALKLHDVPGEQLSGDPADTTQDFLMVDVPTFAAAAPDGFLGNLKLLAATTDRAEGLKKALSVVLRNVEAALEAVGGGSGTLVALGGHPETHPLGSTYWGQAPIRYGEYIAKFALVPVSPSLTVLTDAQVDLDGKPNGLREAVTTAMTRHPAAWDFRVQLNTDLETMPIEDASVEWPVDASPFLTVARLTVSQQPAWDDDLVHAIDDGAAFSPWHGLAAHRPLGGIMRARRPVYAALQAERSGRSGCPFHQR